MSAQHTVQDVVVIGAGLAGLTAAHALRQYGIEAVVLEREGDVGTSWARRHPQLTLNTHRALSTLPGLPYPTGTGAFPKRDTVVAHLRAFRDRHGFAITSDVEVLSVAREDSVFVLKTNAGTWRAHHLIVATGRDAVPRRPHWSGLETFAGRIVHAADFGDARDYAGKSVLVIGGGNSGFDVLNHLGRVKTGPVWLSLRRSPGLLPKRLGRFAVHRLSPVMALFPPAVVDRMIAWTQRIAFGDLAKHGFPAGSADAATRLVRDHVAIAVDDGAIAAVKRGQVSVVPEVIAFSASAVTLAGGRVLHPNIVVAALGYTAALPHGLDALNALDETGAPILPEPAGTATIPGLWFVGMKPSLTSYFLQAQRESKAIARTIAASLDAKRR